MAYYKQPCDSYFVESHDDHGLRLREEIREREVHVKRQTQLAIAEDLSQLAIYEYGDCIQQHMEDMEVRRHALIDILLNILTLEVG